MRALKIFAVVLNWNSAEDTIKCVRSLLATNYPGLSIVVVDNASADDSRQIIMSTIPDIPLLCQPSNGGFASGNNAGILWCLDHGAEFVLVLNNDVTIDRGFFDSIIACAERHPDAGIIGGKVFYADKRERIFCAAGHFSKWRCTGVNRGTLISRLRRHNTESEVNYLSGALLFVRRRVFEEVGLFDERFFMYYEDLDFTRRAASKFRILYTPDAVAYHKSGGGTSWRRYTELYLYYQTRNRFWVFCKDPLYYRLYVAVFTTVITVLKSVVIALNFPHDPDRTGKQLSALWRGLKDGFGHTKGGDS